jgi:hypothetical protein
MSERLVWMIGGLRNCEVIGCLMGKTIIFSVIMVIYRDFATTPVCMGLLRLYAGSTFVFIATQI